MESQGGRRKKKNIALGTDIVEVKLKVESLCSTVIFHIVQKEGLYVSHKFSCPPKSYSLLSYLLTEAHCVWIGNVPILKDWIMFSLIHHDFNVSFISAIWVNGVS